MVGRYLYGQIPRKVTTAELSMRELQDLQAQLSQQLAAQNLLPEADLRALLRLPDANRVARLPIVVAIVYMMILDLARKFRVARLRRHALRGRRIADHARSDSCPPGIAKSSGRFTRPPKKRRCRREFCSFRARKRFSTCGTSCTSRSATPLPCWP